MPDQRYAPCNPSKKGFTQTGDRFVVSLANTDLKMLKETLQVKNADFSAASCKNQHKVFIYPTIRGGEGPSGWIWFLMEILTPGKLLAPLDWKGTCNFICEHLTSSEAGAVTGLLAGCGRLSSLFPVQSDGTLPPNCVCVCVCVCVSFTAVCKQTSPAVKWPLDFLFTLWLLCHMYAVVF